MTWESLPKNSKRSSELEWVFARTGSEDVLGPRPGALGFILSTTALDRPSAGRLRYGRQSERNDDTYAQPRPVMRRITAPLLLGVALMALAPQPSHAESAAERDGRERVECTRNLKQIYAAIQAYQLKYQHLPNWLSDLVPEFLPDANVLVCPVCRRTGQTEGPPLADPKLPCSYLFEFCPVPLDRDLANHSRREWKRRQMGLLGSVVPIVRCRFHHPALNLAFDGHVYDSPAMWELAFTNRVSAYQLTAAALFAKNEREPPNHAHPARPALHFNPRPKELSKTALDLTRFYNAMLTQSWHGFGGSIGNDLSQLPSGVQDFGGVTFDIRGIVQLRSKSTSSTNYPAEIQGIPVHLKCRGLHFLHAAAFGHRADEGHTIGAYVIHYATNQMRLDLPIVYGQDVCDWHTQPDDPPPSKSLDVVWRGQNAVSKEAGQSLRLFMTTWTNPVPEFEIESIDFVSKMLTPAPFLIAITADGM
jgi:hypothetical protein